MAAQGCRGCGQLHAPEPAGRDGTAKSTPAPRRMDLPPVQLHVATSEHTRQIPKNIARRRAAQRPARHVPWSRIASTRYVEKILNSLITKGRTNGNSLQSSAPGLRGPASPLACHNRRPATVVLAVSGLDSRRRAVLVVALKLSMLRPVAALSGQCVTFASQVRRRLCSELQLRQTGLLSGAIQPWLQANGGGGARPG